MASFALPIARALSGASAGWVLVLGGVVVLGALLRGFAHSARSLLAQYATLVLFVVVQAVVFVPLLVAADAQTPGAIRSAAAATGTGFVGLTAVAFTTRRDLHFLCAVVRWGLSVGLIVIISAAAFGFELGDYFCVAMLAMAGTAVVYDTSNMLHHFRGEGRGESLGEGRDEGPDDRNEDSYVAASLELFASIALMFWYTLRLFVTIRP